MNLSNKIQGLPALALGLLLLLTGLASTSEARASLITTTLNSQDEIRVFQNGDPSAYVQNATSDVVGVSGPGGNRIHRNLVYGYTLPTLSDGIASAEFSFDVTDFRDWRNNTFAKPNLDVYLLNTSDPSGTPAFFENQDSPSTNSFFLGQVVGPNAIGGEVGFTASPSFLLDTAAENYLKSLYTPGGTPLQSEIFFRFNIDNGVENEEYDRFRIDTSSPNFAITTVPEPASSLLLSLVLAVFTFRRSRRCLRA